MLHIETPKMEIKKRAQEAYNFLSDFTNHQQMMPDNVSDWKATKDDCSYNIKGLTAITMRILERTPNTGVKIGPGEKAMFQFTLNCSVEEAGSGSKVQMVFDADVNPMIKMMAEKPLQNFFNAIATKFQGVMNV